MNDYAGTLNKQPLLKLHDWDWSINCSNKDPKNDIDTYNFKVVKLTEVNSVSFSPYETAKKDRCKHLFKGGDGPVAYKGSTIKLWCFFIMDD